MEIIWHGHSFFKIITKNKNEKIIIAIDPFSSELGLRVPKIEADILLISHNHFDHNNKAAISGNYFLIEHQGEYEVKNVLIKAIKSFHDNKEGKERGENLMFTIESENLKICHMGDFGQEKLTEKQSEEIGSVDVLMIPVGGKFTISANEATNIIEELEPRIVIPMHYGLPKLKLKLDPVERFLKSFGIKSLVPEKRLSIKKEHLSKDETKIVLLEII